MEKIEVPKRALEDLREVGLNQGWIDRSEVGTYVCNGDSETGRMIAGVVNFLPSPPIWSESERITMREFMKLAFGENRSLSINRPDEALDFLWRAGFNLEVRSKKGEQW